MPTAGSLRLDGNPVSADQIITVSDIINGLLKYTPVANANGNQYASFGFTVSDGEDYSESGANWIVNVTPVNDTASGSVAIIGKTNVGQTLTANSNIAEPDGIGTLKYQWYAGGINIRGAISSTYKLTTVDLGKTINVVVSYVDDDGFTNSFTRELPIGPVTNLNNSPTGWVKITGTATQNNVLSASHLINDVDTYASDAISYVWRANGEIVMDNDGNNATFTLSQAQVGKKITVDAVYVDNQGNAEKVSSPATATVGNINDAPMVDGQLNALLRIEGEAGVGSTLSIGGVISDLDGIAAGAIKYQWFADNVAIRGASSTKYIVGSGNLGKDIKVVATYTDLFGKIEKVESAVVEIGNFGIAPVSPPPMGIAGASSLQYADSLFNSSNSPTPSAYAHDHLYQDAFVEVIGTPNWEIALL